MTPCPESRFKARARFQNWPSVESEMGRRRGSAGISALDRRLAWTTLSWRSQRRRRMQMQTYTLRSDPEPPALTKARLLGARVGEAVTRAAMKSRSPRCFSLADKIDG